MINHKYNFLLIVILFLSITFSQSNVDDLILDVYAGNIITALEELPRLKKKFPEDPAVIYLDALLNKDYEKSIEKYKMIYNLYEDSEYADDAIMKLAEFYYTNGSYVKSSEWLKKINLYYPTSKHRNRSVDLYLRTLMLTGKQDTAQIYLDVFKKKYPDLYLDETLESRITFIKDSKEGNNKVIATEKKEDKKTKEKNKLLKAVEDLKNNIGSIVTVDRKDHFSIQVGVYSNMDNAINVKDDLKELNFNPRIDVIYLKTKDKNLYAVREGYFKSKQFAKNTQKKIKSRAGYETIIVDINK